MAHFSTNFSAGLYTRYTQLSTFDYMYYLRESGHMEYLHTMVRVTNVEKSLDFYCNKQGLEESYRYDSEAVRFTNIFLYAPGDSDAAQTKAPLLELTYNWPPEDGSEPETYTGGRNFGHLAYRVDNIYETCQQLMGAGVTINRPPRDLSACDNAQAGGRMTFIKSPDGISIELLQNGNALEPAEPWNSMENIGEW